MKRSLKEEIERIHTLTYGKKVVSEQNFVDKVLSSIGFNSETKKVDEPGKADLVEPDVADFYKTLQDASQAGGLSQQRKGQMNYQKAVESMQIGLLLLGYKLPRYGVDGLFGPETADAVNHFKNDNGLMNNLSEGKLVQLNSTSFTNVKYDTDNTQYDSVNSDLLNDIQKAASAANVIVTITTAKSGHGTYAKGSSNVSRHMSGAAVDISVINGKKVLTNKDDTLKFVEELKNLGYVINQESGNPKAVLTYGFPGHDNHVHVSNTGGISKLDTSNVMMSATPEMLNKLILLLQQKGLKAADIKQYIDKEVTVGDSKFTSLDITSNEGFTAYSTISQKFIEKYKPNPLGITGEMMAMGAKNAFEKYHRYVPPELALAQLLVEGGIGANDPNVRPVRTKNPFNVGNTDDGKSTTYLSVQDGINAYFNLIAKSYIGSGRTATDLVNNFVNHSGNRYAAQGYEKSLNKIIPIANGISNSVRSAA
jgi:peptidoglycan hydrolase-like protein with peptidoglycan-binding domain